MPVPPPGVAQSVTRNHSRTIGTIKKGPPMRLPRSLFGAFAVIALAISPALAANPIFPVNSRVGLVPPAGFAPSVKFPGFENPELNAAILIVELPGEAFAELEKGFTNEALKARGMTVATRETLTIADGRGLFVAGPQESGGQKRYEAVMIATASGITTVVSVQMLEATHATLTDAILRDSLKTVAVRKQVPDAERVSVLPYKLGNLAGFRIVRSGRDGAAILTEGPNDAVEAVAQPFMIIGIAPGQAPKPEERDTFARRIFSTAPGIKDVKIIRAEPLRMGRANGYEIVAEAKDLRSDVEVTTVQWLRFGSTGYMQMLGIARRATWNDAFTKMRAIRDGVDTP
jgi:hypothetical protein